MAEQYTNNAETTLNGAINNSVTSLVVTSATGFPTIGTFRILLKADGTNADEICTVTAVSGTTFTITRASESTAGTQSAVAHISGATVAHVLTAGSLLQFANAPDLKAYSYTPPTTANSMDDEFSDLASQSGPVNGLDAKWSKHNFGTSTWFRLSDTYAPGCFGFDIPTGQSTEQWIYQSLPGGNCTFQARYANYYSSDRQMFGLAILDTNGTGIGMRLDTGGPFDLMDITTWAQTGNVTAVSPDLQTSFTQGLPLTMWIEYAGGTAPASINVAVTSSDKMLYSLVQTTNRTRSFTPAYIAFGRSFGTGISKGTLDYFRRIA